jgi:glycosyltransferase involved in cell wall biosynthesis
MSETFYQVRTPKMTNPARVDSAQERPALESQAVIIVGPPWPRSGTGRVIQNQIQYYRARGYFTVFIAVPFMWQHIDVAPNEEMLRGMKELGADRVIVSTLPKKSYAAAKYKASARHAVFGTALDWLVAIGRAARLAEADIAFLQGLRPALFHVNHVYTLGFALDLRKRLLPRKPRLPIILETHDVQSQLLGERRERNPWTRRQDRFERLLKSEKTLLEKADVLVHLSVEDFRLFQKLLPRKSHFLVLPTIDEKFLSSVPDGEPPTEKIDLLFLGTSHSANLAALRWFFEQVWPLLADHEYRLKIVGQIGAMAQQELPQLYETFRSHFVGEVPDLAPYYRAARCVIAPMVSGSGTSIKTIEALALGKSFVGTSKAFRGMPMDRLKEAGLQPQDNPQAFANAIVEALDHEREIGALGRAAYEQIFSTQASWVSRDEALRSAAVTR